MAVTTKVAAARALFVALDCIITTTVVYTVATDSLSFRQELLTPWMAATLVDFYINVGANAVWIAYKESSWISTCIWIILLICLGRRGSEKKSKFHSVVMGRIIFSMLGFLMLAMLIYTIITDGSPFRRELLTPWLTASLIDFYVNVVAIAVWVTHKESTWIVMMQVSSG